MDLVAGLGKPVVAAITGYALGGGLELALAADFRVAGASARLGQPEILLGVIPGAGGTQRLPRLVGPAKAKDIVFTGRMLTAAEALEIGLVDRVVPDAEVYQAALDLVQRYANGPALALRAAKQAIDYGLGVDLATGLEIERVQFAALFGTAGPARRHAQLPRTRPRPGHLHRPLTLTSVPERPGPAHPTQSVPPATRRRRA